jgi:hypothetical protein
MLPIQLYTTHVKRDQQRLSNRLQRSIQDQEQLISRRSTRPKIHSAPFKANSKGHVTGNSVYIQNKGTQRHTHFDDNLDVHKITEAEKTQMEAIDRLKNQNSDGTENLGQKEPHLSQPDSRRNTLESSKNIHPSMFSSTARDRHLGIGAGFGSAIKNIKTQRIKPPQVGHLQVGREATQGAKPPQLGHLQVGRQAMLDNRIVMKSHLQVGREALEEPEALEHVIKTNPASITYWPRS